MLTDILVNTVTRRTHTIRTHTPQMVQHGKLWIVMNTVTRTLQHVQKRTIPLRHILRPTLELRTILIGTKLTNDKENELHRLLLHHPHHLLLIVVTRAAIATRKPSTTMVTTPVQANIGPLQSTVHLIVSMLTTLIGIKLEKVTTSLMVMGVQPLTAKSIMAMQCMT